MEVINEIYRSLTQDKEVKNGLRKSKLTEEYLNTLALTEREKEIIQTIKEKGKITSSDVQKKYDISRDTANRWLNKLLKSKLIERKGGRKSSVLYFEGKIMRQICTR